MHKQCTTLKKFNSTYILVARLAGVGIGLREKTISSPPFGEGLKLRFNYNCRVPKNFKSLSAVEYIFSTTGGIVTFCGQPLSKF